MKSAAKIALILRGPPGAGKSTVAKILLALCPSSVWVELDRHWGKGEKRFLKSGRYWDLRDPRKVLIVELGWGEPLGGRFPGATRNP